MGQCNFKIIPSLPETFLKHTKSGLKTEIELENSEIKKLMFGFKEKSSNYAKKCNMCGILSGTCQLFLQMAFFNFNSWSRYLTGIIFQMINSKSLKQDSDKWGFWDLIETL